MSVDVDVRELLQAGAHFGHKTSRWHPKMREYIHSKREGSHIIDLTKTAEALQLALPEIEKLAGEGKQILFVGTKRQAQDLIKQTAEAVNMPFVSVRWLGGMLTNQKTISARIKYLKDLETRMESGELASRYSKLEVQRFQEEITSLNEVLGGIKNMAGQPAALFVVDIVEEVNAVREATKLGIPVFALVDTNADPTSVTHPIPCNDDAIKTIALVLGYVEKAVQAGIGSRKAKTGADKTEEAEK